jgi:hypothetical protein
LLGWRSDGRGGLRPLESTLLVPSSHDAVFRAAADVSSILNFCS